MTMRGEASKKAEEHPAKCVRNDCEDIPVGPCTMASSSFSPADLTSKSFGSAATSSSPKSTIPSAPSKIYESTEALPFLEPINPAEPNVHSALHHHRRLLWTLELSSRTSRRKERHRISPPARWVVEFAADDQQVYIHVQWSRTYGVADGQVVGRHLYATDPSDVASLRTSSSRPLCWCFACSRRVGAMRMAHAIDLSSCSSSDDDTGEICKEDTWASAVPTVYLWGARKHLVLIVCVWSYFSVGDSQTPTRRPAPEGRLQGLRTRVLSRPTLRLLGIRPTLRSPKLIVKNTAFVADAEEDLASGRPRLADRECCCGGKQRGTSFPESQEVPTGERSGQRMTP